MSLFRLLLVLCAFGITAGCGFQPLYGGKENAAISAQLALIQISPIEDRLGQKLRNLLLDRINPRGRPKDPKYTLSVIAKVETLELGLRFTEVATRAKLTLSATFFLVDHESGSVISEGIVRSANSYNIPDSEFARVTSEKDATDRAARDVSDEIRTRLSLYFSDINSRG